jgi:hypothetical protein
MTDEPNVARPTESPRPTRQRLSVLLRHIPSNECFLIIERFEAAVMKGTIKAVPLLGEHFSKVIVLENGTKKRVSLQDEAVLVDDHWHAWVAEQRRESRYRVLLNTGVVATTIDRLKSDEDDFDRLLEIRRKRLRAAQAGGQKGDGS